MHRKPMFVSVVSSRRVLREPLIVQSLVHDGHEEDTTDTM